MQNIENITLEWAGKSRNVTEKWKRSILETFTYTIHIGSTPTILYFDLHLNTAHAAHHV